ncbi:hypothetical protein, partial [Brevibacillus sp. SIMBA_040]
TALNIDAVGYYYFNGTVWTKLNLPVNIYNSNGTLSGNRVVTTGGNLLSFTNGANTINIGTTGTESIVRAIGSSRGTIRTQGGSAIIDLFV